METFWDSMHFIVLSLVSIISLLLTLVVAFHLYFKFLHLTKCVEEIPGVRMVPVLSYLRLLLFFYGQTKYVSHEAAIHTFLTGLCYMHDKSRINQIWITFRPFVFIYKPETVEAVLNNSVNIDKAYEYKFLHPWLKTGLLTSSGKKWRSRRKLLTPTLHFRILEGYIPVFNKHSEILVEKLMELKDEKWIDITPIIKLCTLDIICETTMGVTLNAQNSDAKEYVKSTYGMGEVVVYRTMRPYLWPDWVFSLLPESKIFQKALKVLHSFTKMVIKEKKEEMIQQSSKGIHTDREEDSSVGLRKKKAFLELLLEHHLRDNTLTEDDIQEEVDTFMFEGHDTTAVAICWTLYNLGLRPDIQTKVFSELDRIFNGDLKRAVTNEDIREMKYLECVIKESLRLYPSVPFFGREITENTKLLNYTLTRGMLCFVFPYVLHRDSEIFPNPEHFDPERFTPENSTGRHPYAYIPFSAGPRNCIGQKFALMEEKVVLANILRHFRMISLDHRDTLELSSVLILKNDKPIRMRFIPRFLKEEGEGF